MHECYKQPPTALNCIRVGKHCSGAVLSDSEVQKQRHKSKGNSITRFLQKLLSDVLRNNQCCKSSGHSFVPTEHVHMVLQITWNDQQHICRLLNIQTLHQSDDGRTTPLSTSRTMCKTTIKPLETRKYLTEDVIAIS